MDIFRVRQDLIADYRLFTTSSIDPRVSQHVQDELARQSQWLEPWLSLNPMFASGGSIDELVFEDLPSTGVPYTSPLDDPNTTS